MHTGQYVAGSPKKFIDNYIMNFQIGMISAKIMCIEKISPLMCTHEAVDLGLKCIRLST